MPETIENEARSMKLHLHKSCVQSLLARAGGGACGGGDVLLFSVSLAHSFVIASPKLALQNLNVKGTEF